MGGVPKSYRSKLTWAEYSPARPPLLVGTYNDMFINATQALINNNIPTYQNKCLVTFAASCCCIGIICVIVTLIVTMRCSKDSSSAICTMLGQNNSGQAVANDSQAVVQTARVNDLEAQLESATMMATAAATAGDSNDEVVSQLEEENKALKLDLEDITSDLFHLDSNSFVICNNDPYRNF